MIKSNIASIIKQNSILMADPIHELKYISEMVSVLIPAYNHERYITETIYSIINQTYQYIELIVVDDGSTDSTWDILKSLENECRKRFTRVTFLRQNNQGSCNSFNRCAELALGKYLYFIASDDKAAPNAIEMEIDFLQKNKDYCLVVGENDIIDENGQKIYWDKNKNPIYSMNDAVYVSFSDMLKKTHPDINFTSEHFGKYETFLTTNYIPNGYLIRHSVFDLTGGYRSEAPLEDWYMMLQLSKFGKFKFLESTLFYYRWHTSNTIKNKKIIDDYYKKTIKFEMNQVGKFSSERRRKKSKPLLMKKLSLALYSIVLLISLIPPLNMLIESKKIVQKINRNCDV